MRMRSVRPSTPERREQCGSPPWTPVLIHLFLTVLQPRRNILRLYFPSPRFKNLHPSHRNERVGFCLPGRRKNMFDKQRTSDAPRRTMALLLAMTIALGPTAMPAFAASKPTAKPNWKTATPIRHLVVIFNENVSFDHYFGTYPY